MRVLMMGELPKADPDSGLESHNLYVVKNLRQIDGLTLDFSSFMTEEISWTKRMSLAFKLSFNFPFRYLLSSLFLVKKSKPDILHVQGSVISPYIYFFLLCPYNLKRVITVHGIASQEAESGNYGEFPRMMSFYYRFTEKAAFRRADKIIAVSHMRKKWLVENYGQSVGKKTVIIQNGVDLTAIQKVLQSSGLRESARRQLDIPDGSYLIYLAKGFVPCNGQDYLIKAFAELMKIRKDMSLALAGDGPSRELLVGLAKDLGVSNRVHFLGTIPNSESLKVLSASDMVVVPSARVGGIEEGLSIFLLESMAMGKPVIATNVGGNPDCIKDRENGLLIPEKNVKAICDSILELVVDQSLRERLGMNARKDIIENWTWDRKVRAIYEEYNRITSEEA
jgi:glycosyltransferase involved in cell wall biosynthesis